MQEQDFEVEFIFTDPESKTTRLSLCCAMTESSSHTPPHSHQFHIASHDSNNDDEEEAHIVQTKDSESQTTNSNTGK